MQEIKFTAIFSNGGEVIDFGITLDGRPAEPNDLVEAFTFLGIVNQDFADAISDTFDNILAAQVEMDELLNDE